MDARVASFEAGRDLARAHAERRRSGRRSPKDQQLSAAIARAWPGRSLLFALSRKAREHARPGRNPLHWNVQARITRPFGGPEHTAEPQLLTASSAASAVRAPDLLRSRP